MNIAVEKVGVREGKERFVLVNTVTGSPITARDVSEPTMRRFLAQRGYDNGLIDECFRKARSRHERASTAKAKAAAASAETADADDFDLFLTEIGLEDEESGDA